MTRGAVADPVGRRSDPMVRFFAAEMARQMRRSFRALRLARPGLPPLPEDRPVVVVTNHPSWWDPAFCMVLAPTLFPDRLHFAPMEAGQVERYRFFARVGIWGVAEGRAGAAGFLRTAEAVLGDPRRMVWVTAQGRLADPRGRPLALRPGAAHLMARVPGAVALPLALEYPFWTERRPEALALVGAPLTGEGTAAAWAARLEAGLTDACDSLAALAVARDPAAFEVLAEGRRGTGGVYGLWQRGRALLGGTPHLPDHAPQGGTDPTAGRP